MVEDMDVFSCSESNVRSYCRSYPAIFDRAEGSYLYDVDGRGYLDFLSGSGALNYGHNEPDIHQALVDYLSRKGVLMSLDIHTQAKKQFISTMNELILYPRKLDYKLQFTSPSSTSAIESAVKLARKYTGRNNIIAFTNAYHGMTGVSLGLTGSRAHRQRVSPADITRLPYDGYMGKGMNTVAYFRRLLEDDSSGLDLPAAVVVETIQGEGGLNLASSEWLNALSDLCQQYQIVFIVDDVQSGCGRAGSFFSFERAQITPDIVCLSKSIGGIGLPLALVLMKPYLDVWTVGEDNGTFRGNNLAFVAAHASMVKYWSTSNFQFEIESKSQLITQALVAMVSQYPEFLVQVKGIACMQGIEFFDHRVAKNVKNACFDQGLIIECCGAKDQVLKLMPALNISPEDLNKGLAIIQSAMESVVQLNRLQQGINFNVV